MIELLLKQLGLNEKEILCFLALQRSGKATPTDLAKLTKINRSTAYVICSELAKKGLIIEDFGDSQKSFVAKPPQDLNSLIQKDQRELDLKKAKINTVISELEKLAIPAELPIPKITFIQEEDLENYLYKRRSFWDESVLKYDRTWWGFQDHTLVEQYEKWINDYWTTASEDLTVKLLTNQSQIETKMSELKKYSKRNVKVNLTLKFTSTIWINGDSLVMIVTNQSPHYLVEIVDATLAANLRELFKYLWENS